VPRAGLNQAAVIHAAATIADTNGVGAVSLAKIADQFGVRSPSLYKHVEGLPGVMRGLALLGTKGAQRRISTATIGLSGDDALVAMAAALWQFARDHPGLYAASTSAPDRHDKELVDANTELLETVLAGLRAYRLEGEDAFHAVRGLRAIVHGFVALEASGGFGMPIDVRESFMRLVALFVRGLREAKSSGAQTH
jgi:AcrR family transcriptional regulator